MPRLLQIDGSTGEGGGQILRTALALACCLGQGVEVVNIRARRPKPGLQPQHLAGVRALAGICGAALEGAFLGSTAIRFVPGPVTGGTYRIDVAQQQEGSRGSAGAVSLVLQAMLLPLTLAQAPSHLVLKGGTHVPWSPPVHYVAQALAPALKRMGIGLEVDLRRWGWYPRGGGWIDVRILPAKCLSPLTLEAPGALLGITGLSAVSGLPMHIARRQRDAALQRLGDKGVGTEISLVEAPAQGQGTCLFLRAAFEGSIAGFSALGARGKRAETVGQEAAEALLAFLDTGAAVDTHLADQLLPFMALAHGSSRFTTSAVTRHLQTNAWVIQQFLPLDIAIDGEVGKAGSVVIRR